MVVTLLLHFMWRRRCFVEVISKYDCDCGDTHSKLIEYGFVGK